MDPTPHLLSGRPVLVPLTEPQEALLSWLITYSETNGYFPVLRETAAHMNRSLSRVQSLMAQLEKKGYVAKTMTSSRNIRLTELTKEWFERQQANVQGTLFNNSSRDN